MSMNWVGCLNHKNHNSCSLSYCQCSTSQCRY